MRKLAPARVSYWNDFLISYRVYIMTGSFHISLFEGTLHDDKIHVWFKIATLCMRYPFQSTERPISHRNGWKFRVYMIPSRDFVPEWNSRPSTRTGVNSHRGDSRRHDILWWYHVNKYRAMRGNRSELAPGRKPPRCHLNTPLWVVITLAVITSRFSILIGSTNTNILGYNLSKKISVKVFFVLTLLFSYKWLTPLLSLFYDNRGFYILYMGISWAFLCKKKIEFRVIWQTCLK